VGYAEVFDQINRWRDELRRAHPGGSVIRFLKGEIARESDPQRVEILSWFLADEHIAQGNPDAAEAVRRRRPSQEIFRWYDHWYENEPGDIIVAIDERIRHETHPIKLGALRYLLAEEHRERGNYAASEVAYLADFNANPNDPRPLISLASQKFHDERQPKAAMRIIDRAVEVAMLAGIFRREALGFKARIAVQLKAYPVVEESLRKIMDLTFTPGNLDVDAERDFLDRVPQGAIDANLARVYDEYCRASGWAATASDKDIDKLILSFAQARWQKVAMIAAKVFTECKRDSLWTTLEIVADRVRRLVAEGKLRSQGNLAKPRRSEVKLSN
jgi:hypothetical protein